MTKFIRIPINSTSSVKNGYTFVNVETIIFVQGSTFSTTEIHTVSVGGVGDSSINLTHTTLTSANYGVVKDAINDAIEQTARGQIGTVQLPEGIEITNINFPNS